MNRLRKGGGLELDKGYDVAGFLGVSIVNHNNGDILMTQSGLATKLVEALMIKKLPRNYTPAESTALIKDENGDPPDLRYSYVSIVGMFQYLQGHSRPDITYVVSQVAK